MIENATDENELRGIKQYLSLLLKGAEVATGSARGKELDKDKDVDVDEAGDEADRGAPGAGDKVKATVISLGKVRPSLAVRAVLRRFSSPSEMCAQALLANHLTCLHVVLLRFTSFYFFLLRFTSFCNDYFVLIRCTLFYFVFLPCTSLYFVLLPAAGRVQAVPPHPPPARLRRSGLPLRV